MPFNARREVLIIGFAYHSLLKLDKSGKTQINPSKSKIKGQNWTKRTASDVAAPQRSMTASRGLWRISAPSRLGLRLVQSHHHAGAQRPWSKTDQLEEQRRVRHCSSELHTKLPCLCSRKDHELEKWCSLLSAFNPFVPSVPKTMTPSKS